MASRSFQFTQPRIPPVRLPSPPKSASRSLSRSARRTSHIRAMSAASRSISTMRSGSGRKRQQCSVASRRKVQRRVLTVSLFSRWSGAVELFVGLVEDAVSGPLVAFGQGGTAIEIIHDTSLELPPVNALLARRLMARTRVWELLQGYRGKPAANIDAVVEVLIR